MKEVMINEQETLSKQEKVWEKIETVELETIETPNYDYWLSQNTIDWPIAIRNLWWNYYESWDDDNWAWTVPYDIQITWVWFKPKLIQIVATRAQSWHSVISWGNAVDWSKWSCIYQHDNSNTIISGTSYQSSKIISLEWQVWWTYPDIEAELKSMDNDGFTLTVTRNDLWTNFTFTYTCFW